MGFSEGPYLMGESRQTERQLLKSWDRLDFLRAYHIKMMKTEIQ